jgi:hypothetical protein
MSNAEAGRIAALFNEAEQDKFARRIVALRVFAAVWVLNCLTVSFRCKWAGRDSAWEQYKPEARKFPINRAESHLSAARCVRPHYSWRQSSSAYSSKCHREQYRKSDA